MFFVPKAEGLPSAFCEVTQISVRSSFHHRFYITHLPPKHTSQSCLEAVSNEYATVMPHTNSYSTRASQRSRAPRRRASCSWQCSDLLCRMRSSMVRYVRHLLNFPPIRRQALTVNKHLMSLIGHESSSEQIHLSGFPKTGLLYNIVDR